MMLIQAIIIIVLVCALALLVNKIEDSKRDYISFRESLALAELPIVTFFQNDIKVNLILDTGANKNILDKKISESLEMEKTNKIGKITGIGGVKEDNPVMSITFSYKDRVFIDNFQISDMSGTFDAIKRATGVTVHGIIGNSFMQKYKYVLDFKDLVAYTKK